MHHAVAERLAQLYEKSFGGKERGRFRISMKLLRQLAGRRRLHPDEIQLIGRELFERGYVLIDMESFFAILSQPTMTSYRRVNTETLFADPVKGGAEESNSGAGRGTCNRARIAE